ncbi:MAG: hypothetical protein HEQ39_00050 [Rhizobacter sp.]
MTVLHLDAQLSPARWAELGRPQAAFLRHDGVCAVTSTFDLLYWPGRALYNGHRLRERVCIYAPDLTERWAVFDEARFPVNDVAFHPHEPWVAIATGRYDGGYQFEGELWLWNWQSGDSFRLLSENRDATRVRYLDDGRLVVLLHPPDEGDFEGDAFGTYLGGYINDLRGHEALGLPWCAPDPRLSSFAPVDPRALGFDVGEWAVDTRKNSFDAAFQGQPLARRHRVWDVAWLDDDQVIAVHDTCHAEVWGTTNGELLWQAQGVGHGVQILQQGGRTLVHVMRRDTAPPWESTSHLMEVVDSSLRKWCSFDHTPLISIDRTGRLLCRNTTRTARPGVSRGNDVVVEASGQARALNLGHFDCFNHHMRVDGADALYFLRGTPVSSHEHKVLCRIDASGSVQTVFDWDGRIGGHLMDAHACRLTQRGGWVRACSRYPSQGQGGFFVERLDEHGRSLWTRELEAPATALAELPSTPGRIAYALTNGLVGVIDLDSGDTLWAEPLRIDGLPNMAMSMSIRGERLAMGTLDGRVLVGRWIG